MQVRDFAAHEWPGSYLKDAIGVLLSSHERLTHEVADAKRSRDDAVGRCVEAHAGIEQWRAFYEETRTNLTMAEAQVERLRGLIVARHEAGLLRYASDGDVLKAFADEVRAIREAKPE